MLSSAIFTTSSLQSLWIGSFVTHVVGVLVCGGGYVLYKLIAKCVWFLISARTRSIIRCCLNVLQLEYCLNLVGIVSRASDRFIS